MNSDILRAIQFHVHRETDFLRLLQTCKLFYNLKPHIIFQSCFRRNLHNYRHCVHTHCLIGKYMSHEDDICETLKMKIRGQNRIKCVQSASCIHLPSKLKSLSIIYEKGYVSPKYVNSTNTLKSLTLFNDNHHKIALTAHKHFEMQFLSISCEDPPMLWINLPETLEEFHVNFSINQLPLNLIHLHTLSLIKLENICLSSLPNLRVLNLSRWQHDIQSNTLEKLTIEYCTDYFNLPCHLKKLNIRHSLLKHIEFDVWPQSLEKLVLGFSDFTIRCAWPVNMKVIRVSGVLSFDDHFPPTLKIIESYLSRRAHTKINYLPVNLKTLIVKSEIVELNCDLPSQLKYLEIPSLTCVRPLPENLHTLMIRKLKGSLPSSIEHFELRSITCHDFPEHLQILNIDRIKCHHLPLHLHTLIVRHLVCEKEFPDTLKYLHVKIKCREIKRWPPQLEYLELNRYNLPLPHTMPDTLMVLIAPHCSTKFSVISNHIEHLEMKLSKYAIQ